MGKGLNNCMYPPQEPCAEIQVGLWKSIDSVGKTQPNCYKRAESNLPADEKGPQQGELGSCLVICLYSFYVYLFKCFSRKGVKLFLMRYLKLVASLLEEMNSHFFFL